ncbi:MAG: GspE/PulE family protein [Cephaloticoccus sp.]|nr:GspE/PulE family protein [Cephaloticoccus sp.]MCF7761879.1 GspE/PulE family protein [Cephaloticoccus sp.]
MSAFENFIALLRKDAPTHVELIDTRLELFRSEPGVFFKDMIERGVLPKARICQLWADSQGVAYANPMSVAISTDEFEQLPVEIARRVVAIVLNTIGDSATVAMVEPTNTRQIESLAKILGKTVSPVFAPADEIETVIDMCLGTEGDIAASLQGVYEQIPGMQGAREIKTTEDVDDLVKSKAVIQLLNSIILTAFRRRASDIHFEARADDSRVRMRIDGDMQTIMSLPSAVHTTLVARIKVLCELDLSEKRLPQDGAFELKFGALKTSFRVACLSSLYGEKVVLRVLGSPTDSSQPKLDNMGFAQSIFEGVNRVISRPNGILIVCGPTGSGKTTTLYGCLSELNRPDLNITTIEDPVEYRLADISQHQVNSGIGLTFARVLRSIMRLDPDVILIGEIRDLETAGIATEAALTGHLVLTSLHTNNSLQAVTRLIEIGVESYMVAPTLMGVLSQRLVRRICSSCKEQYTPSETELKTHFKNWEGVPIKLYRGRGCPRCFGSGYAGRVGIHEFLEISERMRELIMLNQSPTLLAEEALRVGHRSLRYDGLKKALIGWTTLEEVERNTQPDVGFTPNED